MSTERAALRSVAGRVAIVMDGLPGSVDPRRSFVDPAQARSHLSRVEELDRATCCGAAIAVLCWPEDEEEAMRLSRQGLPRLLIIGPTTLPVGQRDPLEDWVRLPVTDQDVCVRLRTLRSRAAKQPPRPWLDDAGRLMYQNRWVSLSVTEERLATVLVDRLGHVVPTEVLLEVGWPLGGPAECGWRPAMTRLRHRCAEVGLEVTTVRGRGYGILTPRSFDTAGRDKFVPGAIAPTASE